MSAIDAVKTLLGSDATLATYLTGGLYLKKSKRFALDRKITPAAFDSVTGLLKPCAVIRGRATVPFGLRDPELQYATTRQVCEIWLYNDGDAGYAILEQARDRIFALLDHQRVVAGLLSMWANRIEDERAPELNDAALDREDYLLIGHATGSSSTEPIVLLETGGDLELE